MHNLGRIKRGGVLFSVSVSSSSLLSSTKILMKPCISHFAFDGIFWYMSCDLICELLWISNPLNAASVRVSVAKGQLSGSACTYACTAPLPYFPFFLFFFWGGGRAHDTAIANALASSNWSAHGFKMRLYMIKQPHCKGFKVVQAANHSFTLRQL